MKMSNSSLVSFTRLSPNYNERVNSKFNPTGKVIKITPHHAAGKLTAQALCDIFARKSRGASANYCIGYDGTIALCVPEDKRAWTSGSANNDYLAITIEISNNSGAPNWTISDASLNALIKLCVDICQRNGIEKLNWTGDKSGNLTCHYMFQPTACPGPYLKGKMGYIAEQVNAQIVPVPEPSQPTPSYVAGTKVILKDINLYSSSTATRRASAVTGTYYLWSNEVSSGRMKITNSTGNVGKAGQVTGWVNESDIKKSLNETATPAPAAPTKLSANALADAIMTGKYGNEPARTKNLKAEGYTDAEIQAAQGIINQRYAKPSAPQTIKNGDLVKFNSSASKWATGQTIPNWVKSKSLYVRSNPSNGQCMVSTVKTGAITGVAYVKDLHKI